MHELDVLLHKRITRKQFPVVLGLGLTSMIELLRLANRVSDEKPGSVKEQPPTTPIYGAWRPRTAGGATMPTVLT